MACFTAGTPIVIAHDGTAKMVEDFQPGDLLLARDEHDPAGPLQLKQVEEVFTRTAPVIELVVRGRGMGTTVEHPFYVVERDDFIPAGQIDIGETFQSHDGQLVKLEAIRDTGRVATVYDFRIADFHTYFVGGKEWGFSVWVHNAYKVGKEVRNAAVKEAWTQEADLIRRTGQGTRPWTDKQIKQLLENGKIKGYVGHHISSVNESPLFAGLADNIQFLTSRQHYRIHNNGRYKIPVFGDFLSRE